MSLAVLQQKLMQDEKALSELERVLLTRREALGRRKEALAVLLEMQKEMHQGDATIKELLERDLSAPPPQEYGIVRRATIEAVESMTLEFSTVGVIEAIRAAHPEINVDSNRSNIFGYLNNLVQTGVIQVVEKGSGRRATTYQKIPPEDDTPPPDDPPTPDADPAI